MAKHTYHWKHGWIPLTHTAAMEKAKGDKKKAAEYLEAVDPKHLSREKHVTAGHRNGRVALHDRKSGNTAAMSADDARGLHATGRHVTGVSKGGKVDHRSRLAHELENRPLSDGEVKDLAGVEGSASAHVVKGPDGKYRFTPERAALHAKIIEETLKGAEPQENPRYNVMGGGPASGKSTMEKATPELAENAALVNADEFKLALPEYAEKGMQGAGFTHEESSYLVARATDEAFNRKVNLTLDGTGDSSADKLRSKIKAARDAGYSVHGHYVTVPTDVAVDRAMKRAARSGRLVPESVIRDTHVNVSKVLPEVLDDFDSMALWDNGGDGPLVKVLEKKSGGKSKVLDEGLWDAFVAKGTEGGKPGAPKAGQGAKVDGKAAPKGTFHRGPSSASSSNEAPKAGKIKVGQAVSLRGQANSKVTVAAISPDGQRARIQNAFETGVKGQWVHIGRLVPYGQSTGREAPMGGRAAKATGVSGASVRRR